jgi:hypothetical protein
MQGLEIFASHPPFLRKLLEDVLHQDEGENQERKRCGSELVKHSSRDGKERSRHHLQRTTIQIGSAGMFLERFLSRW